MKKVLMSLFTIAIVGALIGGGVTAWFSDTESKTGNLFRAGTINLDEIVGTVIIPDIKPCEVGWDYIRIHNGGANDGDAWLHFTNVMNFENGINDPEAEAYWENSGFDPDHLRYDNFLEVYTTIDLYIDPYIDEVASGGRYIITEADHVKLADLECLWIPLGELKVSEEIEIWISFHIQGEVGNEFQSDEVQFDLEVFLQQKGSSPPDPPTPEYPSDMRVVRLENKDSSQATPTSAADMVGNEYWTPIIDGTYAILSYDSVAQNFKYTFEAYGLTPGVSYTLIYYADPWPGNNPGAQLGTFTTDSNGDISPYYYSLELNMDLPDPSDANYPDGAKIWLVLSSDWDGSKMTGWDPDNYLFEMRPIKYDDTGV